VRLKEKIREYEAHYKQRKLQFKYCNNRSIDDLYRILAVAERIAAGAGTFVAQAELLHLGRAAAAGAVTLGGGF